MKLRIAKNYLIVAGLFVEISEKLHRSLVFGASDTLSLSLE